MNTIFIPHEEDTRTPAQQYSDGFNQYCDCVRTKDYLTAGELLALTPHEMSGYNAAIRAADAANTPGYEAKMGW